MVFFKILKMTDQIVAFITPSTTQKLLEILKLIKSGLKKLKTIMKTEKTL